MPATNEKRFANSRKQSLSKERLAVKHYKMRVQSDERAHAISPVWAHVGVNDIYSNALYERRKSRATDAQLAGLVSSLTEGQSRAVPISGAVLRRC
ncbi:hypothetical protein AYJ57_14775 [Salipiger sp. CCB-MM3]|nr:hypothetical protein AYJ57_14775 [Salipiger sp. CCB-MM3]